MRAVLVAVVLLLATAGCAGGGSARSAGGAAAVPLGSTSCPEIRAGIDAFNLGDFLDTVDHFEKAIPLAEAEDDGSELAGLLVDAVHYYADLAPEDYLRASASSPEFATYKQVTLGLCEDPSGGPSDGDSGGVSV